MTNCAWTLPEIIEIVVFWLVIFLIIATLHLWWIGRTFVRAIEFARHAENRVLPVSSRELFLVRYRKGMKIVRAFWMTLVVGFVGFVLLAFPPPEWRRAALEYGQYLVAVSPFYFVPVSAGWFFGNRTSTPLLVGINLLFLILFYAAWMLLMRSLPHYMLITYNEQLLDILGYSIGFSFMFYYILPLAIIPWFVGWLRARKLGDGWVLRNLEQFSKVLS